METNATLPAHAFADLLPRMSESEMDELVRDIQSNGQREPATTWQSADGKTWLLDGRHRAIAARRLGKPLRTVQFLSLIHI